MPCTHLGDQMTSPMPEWGLAGSLPQIEISPELLARLSSLSASGDSDSQNESARSEPRPTIQRAATSLGFSSFAPQSPRAKAPQSPKPNPQNVARSALLSLKPASVFVSFGIPHVRTALQAILEEEDPDPDALDTATQILEHMEPEVHSSILQYLQQVFNALWVGIFQWDGLIADGRERMRKVSETLSQLGQERRWRESLDRMLVDIGGAQVFFFCSCPILSATY